jgi:hypothetical protein
MSDEENELWIDRMFPTMKRGDPLRPKLPSKDQEFLYHNAKISAALTMASLSEAQATFVGIYFASDTDASEFVKSVEFLQAHKKGEAS